MLKYNAAAKIQQLRGVDAKTQLSLLSRGPCLYGEYTTSCLSICSEKGADSYPDYAKAAESTSYFSCSNITVYYEK